MLLTNVRDMGLYDIARYYKNLRYVEEAFRELKSNLKTRPIFHWKDRRITGHIFVCFLALLLKIRLKKLLLWY